MRCSPIRCLCWKGNSAGGDFLIEAAHLVVGFGALTFIVRMKRSWSWLHLRQKTLQESRFSTSDKRLGVRWNQ